MNSTEKFKVYSSSAGSGKTFTLVKAYLSIAISSDSPETYKRILAITFTNKAASEMKNRILQKLKIFSSGGIQDDMFIAIKSETSLNEEIIVNRSTKVFQHILHHYSDFSISTIDKFMHRVIRSFTQDLDLPNGFSIVLNVNPVLQEAVSVFINNLNDNSAFLDATLKFAIEKVDLDKNWEIEKDLFRFAENLVMEDGQIAVERNKNLSNSDIGKAAENLKLWLEIFESKISEIGKKALNIIENAGLSFDSFSGGKSGIGKYFIYLHELNYSKFSPTNTILKNVSEGKWHMGKSTNDDRIAIDSIKSELEKLFYESQQIIEKDGSKAHFYSLVTSNMYGLLILNEIRNLLDKIKQEQNIVFISDFNHRISKIVLQETAPFIYERIGEYFEHYLIDEFQDTSVLQWQNLIPLVENGLSKGKDSLIVGDAKQSIYRWRGAKVSQFIKLPEIDKFSNPRITEEREATLRHNYLGCELAINRRSGKVLVDFNNRFFNSLATYAGDSEIDVIYGDLNADPYKDFDGYVEFSICEDSKAYESEVPFNEFEWTLQKLSSCRNAGYSWNQITILVRKNEEGKNILNALMSEGIPVASEESLSLVSSPAVRLMVALLDLMVSRHKKEKKLAVYNELYHLGYFKNSDHQEIESFIYLPFNEIVSITYGNDIPSSNSTSIYELSSGIIDFINDYGFSDVFYTGFLEHILNTSSDHENNISTFLELWTKNGKDISISGNIPGDRVTVMTIHKSKGLEFPVVIVPFANSFIQSGRKEAWVETSDSDISPIKSVLIPVNKSLENTAYNHVLKEESSLNLLDYFNVLYVAFTRASEALFIQSEDKGSKKYVGKFSHQAVRDFKEWDENNSVITLGTLRSQNQNSKEEKSDQILTPFRQNMNNRFNIASKHLNTTPIRTGENLHHLMHKTKNQNETEIMLSKWKDEGQISEAESVELLELAEKLFNHPEILKRNQAILKSYKEREVLLPGGKMMRPDYVGIKQSSEQTEFLIHDYKTGEKHESHIQQILGYEKPFLELGWVNLGSALVYLDGK